MINGYWQIPVYPNQDCECHYGYDCGSGDMEWNIPVGFAITNDIEVFNKYAKTHLLDTNIPEELEY